jgi:hypothetical protein
MTEQRVVEYADKYRNAIGNYCGWLMRPATLLLGRTAITGGDYRSSQKQHTFLLDSHYVEQHQQLIVYTWIYILRL